MKIISGLAQSQVLQRLGSRGATTIINGTSDANGPVLATISSSRGPLKGWKKTTVGKTMRGRFSAKLSGIPAGGPYKLRLEIGKEHADIPSFFVGDVWVLAGQSNMEGAGWIEGAAKPHPLVRAFSMRHEWRLAVDPIHLLIESPDVCHNNGQQCPPEFGERRRKGIPKGAGVGLFFGRDMVRRSGIPQGLIPTAHGGTSMLQWSPERNNLGGESLYYSMMTSIRATGQPVAGVLWYQGESDCDPANALEYTPRMKSLVAQVRRDLRQPRLPWIIVQLARVAGPRNNRDSWIGIREQQRLLPEHIRHLAVAPAIDLALEDAIHLATPGFAKLGPRMARAADHLLNGKSGDLPPPRLRSVRSVNRPPDYLIEIEYDGIRGGLRAGSEPQGFSLLTASGEPLPLIFKTTLQGNTARLHLIKSLTQPAQIGYGLGFDPVCNITDADGFALPAFGPLEIKPPENDRPFLPFVTQWKVTGVQPDVRSLDEVALPDLDALGATVKSYTPDGFINERPQWEHKSGQAFFQARIELPEPMKLEFHMGYDGPFRLWLDGKSFFTDIKGVNPCLPDKAAKAIRLKPGSHDIRVGMDLDYGRSWGFFLRFVRQDVSREQLLKGDYAKPVYWV